jgi:hypothetical protein
MDLHTDQLGFRSEILGYLDKQKQEKLEAAHCLPSVPSFRAQKGDLGASSRSLAGFTTCEH